MAYTSKNFGPCGGDMFICTECGEGFRHFPKLVEHIAIHGIFFPDALSINGGKDTHIEFALHENGTLTVVDRSVVSNFTFLFGKPTPKVSLSSTPNQALLTSSKMPEKERFDVQMFRCERCGQGFKGLKSLQLHQQYRVLEQGFRCTLCCKVFNDKESLLSHLQNHAHERFYSCGHCGKRFLRQETLMSHKKQWHGSLSYKAGIQEDQENSMEKSYPCKLCGLRFFWLSDLQSHLNSHSCVTKFPGNSSQQQDMQGDEERETIPKSQLKKHIPQHSDIKDANNSIDIKLESPTQNGKMRRMKKHLQRFNPAMAGIRGRPRRGSKVHHGSKLFSCKHCHRGFLHSSSLSRHMRYHKGTLHVCIYCGRQFPQRCDVTRHVEMCHSTMTSTLQPQPNNASKTNESSEQKNLTELTQTEGDEVDKQRDMQEDLELSNVDDKLSLESQEKGIYKRKLTYKCKECSRVFSLLSVYKRHLTIHKRDPSKIFLSCPYCPSRFTFRSALDRHIECHEERFKKDVTKLPKSNVDDPENEHQDIDVGKPNKNENDSLPLKVLNEANECLQTQTSHSK